MKQKHMQGRVSAASTERRAHSRDNAWEQYGKSQRMPLVKKTFQPIGRKRACIRKHGHIQYRGTLFAMREMDQGTNHMPRRPGKIAS